MFASMKPEPQERSWAQLDTSEESHAQYYLDAARHAIAIECCGALDALDCHLPGIVFRCAALFFVVPRRLNIWRIRALTPLHVGRPLCWLVSFIFGWGNLAATFLHGLRCLVCLLWAWRSQIRIGGGH